MKKGQIRRSACDLFLCRNCGEKRRRPEARAHVIATGHVLFHPETGDEEKLTGTSYDSSTHSSKEQRR